MDIPVHVYVLDDASFYPFSVFFIFVSLCLCLCLFYRWRCTFLLSLILGIPTVFVAFINSFGKEAIPWPKIYGGVTLQELILFILATIIQVRRVRERE